MTSLSVSVPVVGQPHATEDVKVGNSLTAIQAWSSTIDGVNVDASLTGRRMIAQAAFFFSSTQTTTSYFVGADGVPQQASAGTYSKPTMWWYLDPANYAVTGKSNTQLILRISLAVNNIAPAITWNGQLNAISLGGTGGLITPVAGALQGSAVSVASPAANSVNVAEGAAFAFPSAGAYGAVVNTSAALTSGSAVAITWQLFVRNT